MITMSTPAEQIRHELFSEEGKAFYWLKKYYHGDKGYEQMRDALLEKVNVTMKQKISDVVEYVSQTGNRWMVFECCNYYKGANNAFTTPMAFCYYETYGSVGAYFVGRGVYGETKTVIHFTNHFFLRFCQRLGIEMRSRWMVQRFAEVIPGFLFGYNGKDDKGRDKFDVRIPGSIGRGIMVDGIIEIRTYLTDKELNGKQKRETERLRESYERQTFEPLNVMMSRIAKSEDFAGDVEKEVFNIAAMTGVDRGTLSMMASMRILIVEAIINLGYAKSDDMEMWKSFGKRTAGIDFLEFADGYVERSGKENAVLLYENICEIGKCSGIKGFDAAKVTDYVVKRMNEIVKKIDG